MKKLTNILIPAGAAFSSFIITAFLAQEFLTILPARIRNSIPQPQIIGFVLLSFIAALVFFGIYFAVSNEDFPIKSKRWLVHIRRRSGKLRWILAGFFLISPFILICFTRFGSLVTGIPSRFLITLTCGVAFAFFLSDDPQELVSSKQLSTSFFIFALVFSLGGTYNKVTSYPFSMTWSEGNRFWDYSILFGRKLYDFPADQPIFAFISKGRQSLWGLPFLFGNVSIFQMRLWNAILFTVPYAVFGWIVFQHYKDNRRMWFLAGLWTFLFLNQGPIYTPLALCAILVALAWQSPLWIALPLIAVSGYYAQLTRFTWIFAPAMWAGMVYISDVDIRSIRDIKDSARPLWVSIGAILSGLIGAVAIDRLVKWIGAGTSQQELSAVSDSTNMIGFEKASTILTTSPLIWYRLLPSTTNELGILLLLLLITGPLVILLFYLERKGIWKLSAISRYVILACLLLFMLVGFIISVKIGGGNNIHNMDMFLIALVFCVALAWRQRVDLRILHIDSEPIWVRGLWVGMFFTFAFFPLYQTRPPGTAPAYYVDEVLERINSEVDNAKQNGEILFLDQRQLLTFGYVQDVALVDEYEKKYVMEQAMRDNEGYFQKFHNDLRYQRFSLIISEPLKTKLSEQKVDSGFPEENDAWVINVSRPILCYYEKITAYPKVKIEILKPVENPEPCEWDMVSP